MMITICRTLVCGGCLVVAGLLNACGDRAHSDAVTTVPLVAPVVQFKLPKVLREVSGLASAGEHSVWAIQDERAQLLELDTRDGRIISRRAVGDPIVKGDFEGVAVMQDVAYLVTSEGRLFAADLNSQDKSMPYVEYDLAIGRRCEIEGLAEDRALPLLWLICKTVSRGANGRGLQLYAWSPESGNLVPDLARNLPGVANAGFHPSALEFTHDGSQLLVLAAREAQFALYRWGAEPTLVKRGPLPTAGRHRQAEGLAAIGGGQWAVADEGKNKRGILSRYQAMWR